MKSFHDEKVFAMPPMSMASIEKLSIASLEVLAPEILVRPCRLDLLRLIDEVLPKFAIHVSPASSDELGDLEAATDPDGESDVEILVREDLFDDLYSEGSKGNRVRATVTHELSHAIIHVPVVRGRLRTPEREYLLARVNRGSIPAYRDPEWQAWALAGCLLMPRQTIVMLADQSLANISEVYGVSSEFTQSHCKRLRLT